VLVSGSVYWPLRRISKGNELLGRAKGLLLREKRRRMLRPRRRAHRWGRHRHHSLYFIDRVRELRVLQLLPVQRAHLRNVLSEGAEASRTSHRARRTRATGDADDVVMQQM